MNPSELPILNGIIKKKRGRKPKCKPVDIILSGVHENASISKQSINILKVEELATKTLQQAPSKRGRKPKTVINTTDNPVYLPHDNLIIHLPIKSSDVSDMLNINYIKNNGRDLSPEPYDVENNFAYIKENKKVDSIINPHVKKQLPLFINNNIKLINTSIEFYNSKTKERLPETTYQHCQWCTCSFDTPPISLPLSRINNKFYVTGCFCTFNCALAYNYDKYQSTKWENSALLHLLYKMIHNKYTKILPAPPKELLKIYGGPLTIEEYRHNLETNKNTYSVLQPPIISIIPLVEEISNSDKMKNELYVPLNLDLIDTSLSIKSQIMKEPVSTNVQNTLQSYMDLSVKKVKYT